MDGSRLVYRHDGKEEVIGTTDQFNLVGQCNYENIMAAAAIGTAMGVPMETIRQTAYNFKAVEHRIEYTATKKQVRYYNDSKGTNPDAAIQGIRAMTTPTCLIGGGYDKGSTYDEWIEAFGSTIKYLVLIGQTSKAIADCCEKHGFTNYEFATSMEEAVENVHHMQSLMRLYCYHRHVQAGACLTIMSKEDAFSRSLSENFQIKNKMIVKNKK